MALVALLAPAFIVLMVAIARTSAHGKSLRLKCVCKFKTVTPNEDLGFIQALLREERSVNIGRITKRSENGEPVFELEYSTDAKTQKRILVLLNAREGLRELRVLSGSERHANVLFISKELSLSRGLRKEEHQTRHSKLAGKYDITHGRKRNFSNRG